MIIPELVESFRKILYLISFEKKMTERFIPEVPLAVHIELKKKSKTDRRAFTIETVLKWKMIFYV